MTRNGRAPGPQTLRSQPSLRQRPLYGLMCRASLARRGRDRRQADGELAALAEPGAGRLGGAAVEFNDAADEGQAEAEPAWLLVEPPLRLHEEIEDPRQDRRHDADAVVAHPHHGARRCIDVQRDPDASTRVRELDRVPEQIAEDLFEPARIAVHPDGMLAECDRQLLPARVELGTRALEIGRASCRE